MNKKNQHIVYEVKPNSIAEELEIEKGDVILSINDQIVNDIFDYHYLIEDEELLLVVRKANGEEWELEIFKDYDEDLGIVFENSLMDDYKSCYNKCIFCFIDQNPPGMRDTIYFKDDDSRLSFLQGNYITLTNMKEEDIDRIIKYHLAPINISVHATNPELRCKMLNNRFAGTIMERLKKFYDAKIPMNGQIVLCKGYNDKEELKRTIEDLMTLLPYMESLSVVPIGLTKYREGLTQVEPFNKEDAKEVIETIEHYQKICMEKYQMHFVQASDEWYIKAELPLPEEDRYDGYIQLENGVGMTRLFMDEVKERLKELDDKIKDKDSYHGHISTITGMLVYPYIMDCVKLINQLFKNIKISVYPIRNDFFGEMITVTGLITGQDICNQLKDEDLGDCLMIPNATLKADEDIFLDDMHLLDVQKTLQVNTCIVKSSGMDFVDCILENIEVIK